MFNRTNLGVSIATNTEVNNIHNERPVGNNTGFIRIKDKIFDRSNIDDIKFIDGKTTGKSGRFYCEHGCYSQFETYEKEKIVVYTKDGKKEIIEFDADIIRMGENNYSIKDFIFGKGRKEFEKVAKELT
jgi:hypothetical protein